MSYAEAFSNFAVNKTQDWCGEARKGPLTCTRSLACYWTAVGGPFLAGSTPCGRAFLGSVDRKRSDGQSR